MTYSGRNRLIALGMLFALIGALIVVLKPMQSDTTTVAQTTPNKSAPGAPETAPTVAPLMTVAESPQSIEEVAPVPETASVETSSESVEEPYYWQAFASMRASAVSDPNSEQNQATLRRLREMRRANLSNEE